MTQKSRYGHFFFSSIQRIVCQDLLGLRPGNYTYVPTQTGVVSQITTRKVRSNGKQIKCLIGVNILTR